MLWVTVDKPTEVTKKLDTELYAFFQEDGCFRCGENIFCRIWTKDNLYLDINVLNLSLVE